MGPQEAPAVTAAAIVKRGCEERTWVKLRNPKPTTLLASSFNIGNVGVGAGVCCSVWRSVLQCAAVCCSVQQCVAVCCSVVRCGAVCSSVEQSSNWGSGARV